MTEPLKKSDVGKDDAKFDHQEPPVEDRSDYVSRTRLDMIQHAYVQWSRRTLIILSIIGVVSLTSGIVSAALYWRIQGAREAACKRTNLRHDNAIDQLKVGSDLDIANAPNEAAKAEIRRRRDVTITLIDALQPKQDCSTI